MLVTHTIAEIRSARREFGPIALVPTMGALHAGHLSLIQAARNFASKVAVSIFVNPTQFGPQEDFTKYPRPIEKDLAQCKDAGVDLIFNPSVEEMYPPGDPFLRQTIVDIPALTTVLEGKHRPGHFHGVCQVVAKLFNIIQPNVACFGQKDYQQFRVLSAMVDALNFPVEMKMLPTIRDPDGLALSSRNAYLSAEQRGQALTISRALFKAREDTAAGIHQTNRLIATMRNMLIENHVTVDYAAAVDARTLKPIEQITSPTLLAIAARVGNTRLIDNVLIGEQ
ncbi:MAG TPA: pantoate--beta-alanine ligase [Tepidisphaeraceae bacterium]|nr:pantoate--beta-alanine ligase [Tepidisphaeraceae bacterium]